MKDTKKVITKKGVVTSIEMGNLYRIELEDSTLALAEVSGKMRKGRIRILIGDTVEVEFSPHDLTRGRITWRHR
jgi:translation initiation factor IF-1